MLSVCAWMGTKPNLKGGCLGVCAQPAQSAPTEQSPKGEFPKRTKKIQVRVSATDPTGRFGGQAHRMFPRATESSSANSIRAIKDM